MWATTAANAVIENGGKAVKRSGIILVSVLAVFLSGCSQYIGSGGNGGGGGVPLPFTITVTPTNPTVAGMTQQQFTAKTSDGTKPALSWSVNGVAGGSATLGIISATGMYSAPEFPPSPNTITISAVETADSSKSGKTGVTLANPTPELDAVLPISIPVGAFSLTLSAR
jgi:hypothetical protein